MLDLVRLRVLTAVARHGSITAAARELDYAPASVSHHIARLEAEVGLPLTRRAGRGIRLTPAAELLAQRATEILGRVESAEAELAALGGLRRGRVRVAGFQSALSTVVTDAAVRMRESAPDIELSLTEMHPERSLRHLREGLVDAAVVFRYDDEVPDDMRFTHLFDDSMYLLSTEADQKLTDHRDSPWIECCQRCRREFVDACEAAGFTPRITYPDVDPMVKQSMVAAELGVTTYPGLALAIHRAPGIEISELTDFRRRVYVATYGDPPDMPATTAFVQAVVAAATRSAHRLSPLRSGSRVVPPSRTSSIRASA